MRRPFVAGRAVITVMIAIVAGACAATPTSPSATSPTAIVESPSASAAAGAQPSPSFPAGAKIDGRIQVGEPVAPRWFAADDTSLWVHEPTSMVRVDLATSAVTGEILLPYMEYGYDTTGAGSIWQTDNEGDHVLRIDPVLGKVVKSIPVGSAPAGVAVTAGSVWVADEHSGAVTRIDPTTNKVLATIPVGPVAPNGPQIMSAGPGGVWVGIQHTGENVRVDPRPTRWPAVPLDGPVASDGKQVWIGVERAERRVPGRPDRSGLGQAHHRGRA